MSARITTATLQDKEDWDLSIPFFHESRNSYNYRQRTGQIRDVLRSICSECAYDSWGHSLYAIGLGCRSGGCLQHPNHPGCGQLYYPAYFAFTFGQKITDQSPSLSPIFPTRTIFLSSTLSGQRNRKVRWQARVNELIYPNDTNTLECSRGISLNPL